MAALDLTALTALNPKESTDFQQFIVERTYASPEIKALHNFVSGVTMKQQLILSSKLGKTGLKADGCTRKNSGAKSILTEKFYEPQMIEDTISLCKQEINALFKAVFDKVQNYKEKFEIEGTDEEVFLILLIENAIRERLPQIVWLADKDVAEAEAAAEGVITAGDIAFYNYFNGFWKQIRAAVAGGKIPRVEITENGLGTTELQTALADGFSVSLFEQIWKKADPRLRAETNAKLYVSGGIWENYRQYLQSKGENFTIDYTQEGFTVIKWNGRDVVNMETVWDVPLQADFVANTTDNTYILPNRAVLTTPENLHVATLNENDFNELDTHYGWEERLYHIAYGFTLDAVLAEEYMVVAAY